MEIITSHSWLLSLPGFPSCGQFTWIGGLLGYQPFYREYTTDWELVVAKIQIPEYLVLSKEHAGGLLGCNELGETWGDRALE